MSDILDKLKKIQKLANRGSTESEKRTAQNLLNQLSAKYNISLEDLKDYTSKNIYTWHCSTDDEKDLLIQILSKVIQEQYMDLIEKEDRQFGLKLTYLQYVEVDTLFGLYKDQLMNEIYYLKQAFYKKHNLFPPTPSDCTVDNNISEDDIKQILKYFQNLKYIAPYKQIGN